MEVLSVVRVISECLAILVYLFEGYLLQFFLGSFLENRVARSRWNRFYVVAAYGILVFGMDYCLPSDYGNIRIFGKKLLALVIICAVALCFYKAVRAITFFLIATFMAVKDICFFIAYTLMTTGQYLTDMWLGLYEQGYFASLDAFMLAVETTLLILQFIMYVIFLVLSYLSLKKIIASFREKEYAIHKKELHFILTPSLVGLLLCILLRMIMITVEDEVPELLYDRYPLLVVIVPAIMFLSLLSILYSVKLFQDMVVLNRERNSRIILEKQIDSLQEHVKEVERIYADVRGMKHDMKNTLSVIMQLASKNGENENAELQAYLSELNQTMSRLDLQFKTGNSVVDTLLNMKYHEITRTIPKLQMNADRLIFPEHLQIQGYDLGIILGNALDNAIEACNRLKVAEKEEETFIRLSSFQRGHMFFVEIENSFDGKVVRKKNSEFPITSKTDSKSHGIGLVNIQNTAEKYHGAVDWVVDNKVFTLTVMLKNERRNEDECRIDGGGI